MTSTTTTTTLLLLFLAAAAAVHGARNPAFGPEHNGGFYYQEKEIAPAAGGKKPHIVFFLVGAVAVGPPSSSPIPNTLLLPPPPHRSTTLAGRTWARTATRPTPRCRPRTWTSSSRVRPPKQCCVCGGGTDHDRRLPKSPPQKRRHPLQPPLRVQGWREELPFVIQPTLTSTAKTSPAVLQPDAQVEREAGLLQQLQHL